MDHEANTNLGDDPVRAVAHWRPELRPDAGRTGMVYDPATGNPLDGTGRTPFAGNMIPANRINPVSRRS